MDKLLMYIHKIPINQSDVNERIKKQIHYGSVFCLRFFESVDFLHQSRLVARNRVELEQILLHRLIEFLPN